MNKNALRKQLKLSRQSISERERMVRSEHICERLAAMDWSNIHSIHYYEPLKELGEVNIHPFLKFLQGNYPKLKRYTTRKFHGAWELVSSSGGHVASTLQFDAVIVPMLGFDSALQRIGYGGGYYDRLLATQTLAQKIGVSFEAGKLSHIPSEPHDVALNLIITETRIYTLT